MNKIEIFTNLVTDGMKLTDKSDIFKDFFNGSDEFLSSSSWGNLIKFCATKKIEISDINEAYYFTIFTAYLDTFSKALKYYVIDSNNLAVPKYDISYNYEELNISNISGNNLVQKFHDIFKEFVPTKEQNKVIKYINNNIKLSFYKVIEKNPLVLNKYIKYINSDIFKIEQNDFNKQLYNMEIEQEYKDIVLADKEGLTLKDLYIEPYFRVFKKHFTKDDERLEKGSYQSKYCDIEDTSIHTFITDTLNGKNKLNLEIKDINSIFISGYPGQGKSSFTKRFVFDILNDNIDLQYDVILIKLKNIENPNDFLNKELQTIVKENMPFEIESLDNYIVVLDGLDELVMKYGISIQDSNTICERIARSKIKTIVTTRHSYVDFEKLYEKSILTIELKELNQEQQICWLDKYTNTHKNIKLTREIIEQFHENENNHILELINQPILLHMIADMNIDDIEDLDKSRLYKKFFDILVNRKWEKDKHTLVDGIDEDDAKHALRNMLQELSHNIFQSEHEYIHKIDFEKLESVKEFQELLVTRNNESLQDNLKGVMVSFYFKEVKKENTDIRIDEQNENYAIEFLHKSLMEYMVAEYIWEKVQDLLEKNRYGKYTFDEKQALELFWNLFHKKMLSNEIVNNLIQIIENEVQQKKDELSERLDSFMSYFLDKGFVYEINSTDIKPLEKSVATFYGFWTIISSLDNKNHIVKNKFTNKLINKFRILRTTFSNTKLNLSNNDLSGLEINNINLEDVDISNCDLSNSTIKHANLQGVDFSNTLLINTNLHSVDTFEVNWDNCFIDNLDIFTSGIWYLTIENKTIKDSKVLMSSMYEFELRNTHVINVEFDSLRIYYSNFQNSTFEKTMFSGVIFQSDGGENFKTRFESVEFINCTFEDVIFYKVKFLTCPQIDFEDLKKQGAVFIKCTNDGEKI